MHERLHHPELLPVALGQVLDPPAQVQVEPLGEGPVRRGGHPTAHRPEEAEQVLPTHPLVQGQVTGQVSGLGADLHPPAAHVEPQQPGLPTRRADQPQQHPDRRRLARAVRPQEPDDLAAVHGQGQVLDPALAAVELRQTIGLQHHTRADSHSLSVIPTRRAARAVGPDRSRLTPRRRRSRRA